MANSYIDAAASNTGLLPKPEECNSLQGKKSGDYIVASEALHRDIVGTCSVGLVVDGAYEIEDGGGRVGRQRDSIQEHGFDVSPLPVGDKKTTPFYYHPGQWRRRKSWCPDFSLHFENLLRHAP